MLRSLLRNPLVALTTVLVFGGGCGGDDDPAGPKGRTWRVPGDLATIEAACDAAQAGDVVEVAPGTYLETQVHLRSGVTLRGEPGGGPVVVRGDETATVTADAGQQTTVLQDITFSHILGAELAGRIEVRRCRFAHSGNREGPIAQSGGAVSVRSGTALFQDCAFDSNAVVANEDVRGGGLGAFGATVTLERCTFTGNGPGPLSGGAAYIAGNAAITDCTFERNRSTNTCGALLLGDGIVSISGCTFVDNGSNLHSGAIGAFADSTSITGCTFSGNSATNGGALWLDGHARLSSCVFLHNTAYRGGAVGLGGQNTLANCTFDDNQAGGIGGLCWATGGRSRFVSCALMGSQAPNGGALYVQGGHQTLEDCSVAANSATAYGGAAYVTSEAAPCTLTISGTNIQNNSAGTDAGGICLRPTGSVLLASSSLIAGNAAPAHADGWVGATCRAELTCCDWTTAEWLNEGALIRLDEGCAKAAAIGTDPRWR